MNKKETMISINDDFRRQLIVYVEGDKIVIQERSTAVYIDKDQVDELIDALKKLKNYL